tara:strand:- start:1358 stop:2953 length:1596 start_codon:yes stop_codon:yes gene_type:complete
MSNNQPREITNISYRDETLTLKDGIKLKSRIWLPNHSGPWPALLMRQPYGREIASSVTYAHPSWWATNGYLVIIQDVRGQGESQGEFKGFSQEAADTTETHSWARSLKECNGKLGTYGFSYQGFTQLVALKDTPPPDCIATAMTGLEEKRHWSCDGNAYWWHLGLAWGLQLAALQAKRNNNQEAWTTIRRSLENGDYLRTGIQLLEKYDPNGMAYQWFLTSNQPEGPFKTHKPLNSWFKTPMLLIGTWWDPHLRGILDIYQKSISIGGKPELHIGPGSHLEWWEGAQSLHLRFFDSHLKINKNLEYSESQKNLWNISTKQWLQNKPRSQVESPHWGLFSQGGACFDINEGTIKADTTGEGWCELVHDPWRPVPSQGGHLSLEPGLVERDQIDSRFDVAKFTSAPQRKNVELVGIPSLELCIKSDQQGFDICVALSIISKSTLKANQISTGFLRVIGKEAKENKKRKVFLQPICATVKSEEQIRISISGSSWPAIGINHGDGQTPPGPSNLNSLVITLRVDLKQSKLEILEF